MKILQINTTVNSGSTGRIAEDIGKILLDLGHESYIAYGRGGNSSDSKLIKIGKRFDTYFHGFKTAVFDRHGFGSKKATRHLINEIEKIRPDVIGLHNIHGYYLNIELLFNYLKSQHIPVVWTLHDTWSFTGHCTFYDSVGCEKWKTLCQQCPKKSMYPSSYLLDNSRNNFLDKKRIFNQLENLHLVTPSQWLHNAVKLSFLKSHSISVVHNGVDLNIFKPAVHTELEGLYSAFGFLKHKKIILGVANIWDKRKGLDDFIQLHSQLSEDFKIVLIGLSKTQLSNLPEGMLGITRTENVQELAEWYSLADVFVNPTYQDNFPTTNLEALACGTPVITYDTGGSPEAIDLVTGEIIKKGDIQSLKQVIEKWCTNNSVETSKECRIRAKKYFNKEDRYKDYLALYEQVSKRK